MEANVKCYQCGGTQEIQMYDQEDGICKFCYDQQITQMLFYKNLRTTKYPQIDQIEEGIYLGNEDAATSENILRENNITAICVCGSYLSTPFSKNPNYSYKIYSIQDFPKQSIKQHFADHYEWMNEMRKQKRNILIHCAAGVSRSASFTIAYFMKQKKMPFNKALKFVKEKRKFINPNSGFRRQLTEYHTELGFPAMTQQWNQQSQP